MIRTYIIKGCNCKKVGGCKENKSCGCNKNSKLLEESYDLARFKCTPKTCNCSCYKEEVKDTPDYSEEEGSSDDDTETLWRTDNNDEENLQVTSSSENDID